MNKIEIEDLKEENDYKQIIYLVSESAGYDILNQTEKIISDICKEYNLSHALFLDISERIKKEVDIFRILEDEHFEHLEIKHLEKDWKCLGKPTAIKWDLSGYKESEQA